MPFKVHTSWLGQQNFHLTENFLFNAIHFALSSLKSLNRSTTRCRVPTSLMRGFQTSNGNSVRSFTASMINRLAGYAKKLACDISYKNLNILILSSLSPQIPLSGFVNVLFFMGDHEWMDSCTSNFF